jgi:hypothetical protein
MNQYFYVCGTRQAAWMLALMLLCIISCTAILHAQEPYKMTINYANNQEPTAIAVWTVRSLALTTPAGSAVPDKIAISYRASTAPTTTLALATIRDITFSGSPLYTGDTMRIARKSGSALSVVGASVRKITFESLSTQVADRNSTEGASVLAYPNPSASLSTIEYSLPRSSEIVAIMYDMQGNEVLTLARGYREAGKHTLEWNRADSQNRRVAAGIYLCRITSAAAVLAETMIVLY